MHWMQFKRSKPNSDLAPSVSKFDISNKVPGCLHMRICLALLSLDQGRGLHSTSGYSAKWPAKRYGLLIGLTSAGGGLAVRALKRHNECLSLSSFMSPLPRGLVGEEAMSPSKRVHIYCTAHVSQCNGLLLLGSGIWRTAGLRARWIWLRKKHYKH